MNTTERRPQKRTGAQQETGAGRNAQHTTDGANDGQLTLGQEPSARERPGLQRAQDNADDWWWKVAMRALKWLAAAPGTFEAYDLSLMGVPEPSSAHHWGALFSAAAKAGVIEHAGFTVSRRPTRSGGLCRVWRGAS